MEHKAKIKSNKVNKSNSKLKEIELEKARAGSLKAIQALRAKHNVTLLK